MRPAERLLLGYLTIMMVLVIAFRDGVTSWPVLIGGYALMALFLMFLARRPLRFIRFARCVRENAPDRAGNTHQPREGLWGILA
ncbi:hypothetical protein [Nonomuraea diastatica]|uniref:Uncharacterized protein n=1 Tax=Nonomuraea diastatica TaxID=1848329 RepID=A0A4R4W565_9ACTN|nr:hypothetical protein [Nonomuraea diastatica]TDD11153.1 hypothetical protein E1294_45420 [Nonomuraea diastatica]